MTPSTGQENVMKRGRPLDRSYALGSRCVRRKMCSAAGFAWACLIGLAAVSRGDEFARLEGALFCDLIGRPDAHAHPHLTFGELETLPGVLRDERAALV